MDTQTLLMLAGERYPVGDLACAILGGEDAYLPLLDAIDERGINVEPLELVGHRYLFKTIAHYYEGVVRRVTVAQIEIVDVTMIFSMGKASDVLETRKWRRAEKYADSTRPEIIQRGMTPSITYLGSK